MSVLQERSASLSMNSVPLAEIAAAAGTPCYVYSADAILERYRAYDEAFGEQHHQILYAVKANSNLAVLRLLADAGAGFDIVSGGELFRVLRAGGEPAKIVFSGVGKTVPEMEYALSHRIGSFNCESERELILLSEAAARMSQRPKVALRVNPDVDAATHPFISTGLREHKFGIGIEEAEGIYARARTLPNVQLDGVSCHIGSQILDTTPLLEAVRKVIDLTLRLRAAGIPIRTLDLGGGLGVPYKPRENRPHVRPFIESVCELVRPLDVELAIEPGRSLVAEAGVLLTRVLYRKHNGSKEFIVVDAAMNDLLRPSLYGAHHEIVPVRANGSSPIRADVVGPVCESGDFFAKDREMPDVQPGELLAVLTAGAYAFVAASNYNTRLRPPEVLVEGDRWRIVRKRESYEDLVRGEDAGAAGASSL